MSTPIFKIGMVLYFCNTNDKTRCLDDEAATHNVSVRSEAGVVKTDIRSETCVEFSY